MAGDYIIFCLSCCFCCVECRSHDYFHHKQIRLSIRCHGWTVLTFFSAIKNIYSSHTLEQSLKLQITVHRECTNIAQGGQQHHETPNALRETLQTHSNWDHHCHGLVEIAGKSCVRCRERLSHVDLEHVVGACKHPQKARQTQNAWRQLIYQGEDLAICHGLFFRPAWAWKKNAWYQQEKSRWQAHVKCHIHRAQIEPLSQLVGQDHVQGTGKNGHSLNCYTKAQLVVMLRLSSLRLWLSQCGQGCARDSTKHANDLLDKGCAAFRHFSRDTSLYCSSCDGQTGAEEQVERER